MPHVEQFALKGSHLSDQTVGNLQGVVVGLKQEATGRKSLLEDRGDNRFPPRADFRCFFVAGNPNWLYCKHVCLEVVCQIVVFSMQMLHFS